MDLGFPLGIRLTHAFNLVFLTLLIRSGIEILGGHPMLYFNDHCRPGSEWIRFTSKRMFRNLRWTAEDEKEPYTPWLALPVTCTRPDIMFSATPGPTWPFTRISASWFMPAQ